MWSSDGAAAGYTDDDAMAETVEALARSAGTRAHRRVFGRSVLGRDLVAVTVSAPGTTPSESRPHAVVIANIHGLEVISSELALAVLADLCEPTPDAAALLAAADVTVVPVVNVDGRTRALESTRGRRLFNNAPRRNANAVDLNRNWPWPDGAMDHWLPLAGVKTKRLPWCRGPHPLSEPETEALAALFAARPPFALLNLHSTGRIITHPWSCRPDPPPDLEGFIAMIDAFRAAQTTWRYRWKQGRAWYPIVGSSNDYVYDRYRTLAITVEIESEGAAVRTRWRLGRWAFWFANPVDPAPHVANDRAACVAALVAAAAHRGFVPATVAGP